MDRLTKKRKLAEIRKKLKGTKKIKVKGSRVFSTFKNDYNNMIKDLEEKSDRPILKRLFSPERLKYFEETSEIDKNYEDFAKLIAKSIQKFEDDDKFSPKESFFDYVNNQWIDEKSREMQDKPKYFVKVDSFRIVQDKVYNEVLDYAQNYINNNKSNRKAQAIKTIKDCIEKANKEKGLSHCKGIKLQVDTFRITGDMYGLLAYVNQNEIFAWQSPIVWTLRPDEKNVKKYISHLSTGKLGLYDYTLYFDNPDDDDKTKKFKAGYKKKYFEFIDKVFKICLPDDYEEFSAQDIWDTEVELLLAMGGANCDVVKDSPEYYHKLASEDVEEKYGFDWTTFTKKLGQKLGPCGNLNKEGESVFKNPPSVLVVSSVSALNCTTQLLKEKWNTAKWRAYWLFIFFKQMIRFDWDWGEIYFDFYEKFQKGQPIRMPKRIYSIFPLSFAFNTFLTQQYVSYNYNPVAMLYVKNLVEDYKYLFKRKIQKNTWLSFKTRKLAIEKLDKLRAIIGMPDKLIEDPVLKYVDDDPWVNMAMIANWRRKQLFGLEGKNVIDIAEIDWDKFKMIGTQAYTVNAYMIPTKNAIYFPLAYLQPPFIDLEQRGIEYNLAYIGYTVGHEISHCLDNQGSKFDSDGNMISWWSDTDRERFKKKGDDVIKQYEEFAARDGVIFDAKIGLGEDLADISGLSLSEEYLFYFLLANKNQSLIKKLSLARFYTYCAIQSRQKVHGSAIPALLKQSPHPLEKYRCNCPLARFPLFRELYGVKEGDGMYWHNSDTIW
tara:strand:- start:16003 stop:18315 length:2313 start_codon:yes stop_codon:yes gene_type:complete